jgi:uncharacterized RDD family membrane protein YckC
MVIQDLSAPQFTAQSPIRPAIALDRFLAGIFDLLLLVPIATFVPAFHIHEARLDYLQGFESTLWYQIVLLWILSYIAIQTVFLYFASATPGQLIMHLRVRSISNVDLRIADGGLVEAKRGSRRQEGRLTWNQSLMRALFSLISWIFLGLPFLEVVTHPMKRAWHDRVSDSFVVDLKHKSHFRDVRLNVTLVRFVMVLGIFTILMGFFSFIDGYDELLFAGEVKSTDTTDSLIAQALLKKDFSEDTQNEIEERIWSSGRGWEKALAYFFKLNVEKNPDMRKALSEQICKWSLSQSPGNLCALGKYILNSDGKTLQAVVQNSGSTATLTARVFVLKELTKTAQLDSAVKMYKQLKKQASLTESFRDSLKIWDVSLFWAIRENQTKNRRVPASEDESVALKEYIQERSEP